MNIRNLYYKHPSVCIKLIEHIEQRELFGDLSYERFEHKMNISKIAQYPLIMRSFFELNGVKFGITPTSNGYSYRIYYEAIIDKDISTGVHYNNKPMYVMLCGQPCEYLNAEKAGIERVFDILSNYIESGKRLLYKKETK